jgi:hypothetical protein
MRYLKLFENFDDIDSRGIYWRIRNACKIYDINNYIINEDGTIDVSGSVYLDYRELIKLPLKFRNVTGNFYCQNNQLTSLEGCPQSVGGHFFCSYNQLKTLDGCPKSVGGHFYCSNNPCTRIYDEWIDTDRREELMDMMKDYDFLRGDVINWYLLEAFFEDAGLEIPDREELEEDYTIED